MRAAKEQFWAQEMRRLGPAGALAAGEALLLHVRSVDPDWPRESDRAADLAHHVELADKLARASDVLSGW